MNSKKNRRGRRENATGGQPMRTIRLRKVENGPGYTAEYNMDPGRFAWVPIGRSYTGNGAMTGTREEWRAEARARGVRLWENRPAQYLSKRQLAAAG